MESDNEVAPKAHDAAVSSSKVEKRAEKTASSSSGGEEEEEVNVVVSDAAAKGKQVAAEGNSDGLDSSDSSTYLISQSIPSEITEALGMKHATLIGG